jgi:hypothetical protein
LLGGSGGDGPPPDNKAHLMTKAPIALAVALTAALALSACQKKAAENTTAGAENAAAPAETTNTAPAAPATNTETNAMASNTASNTTTPAPK